MCWRHNADDETPYQMCVGGGLEFEAHKDMKGAYRMDTRGSSNQVGQGD